MGDTVPLERDTETSCDETEPRRKFLQTVGKWSAVVIAASVAKLGEAVDPREAHGMSKRHGDIFPVRLVSEESHLPMLLTYSTKLVMVRNRTGAQITVKAKWHDGTSWKGWAKWDFHPGHELYLAYNGTNIEVKLLRICARNNQRSWGDCNEVKTICESSYVEPKRTWTQTYTP